MIADELLQIAADLARRETGRPRQSSLKRAVSTAYYALFHALAHECVDRTIGWRLRSADYWSSVTPIYRALDHGSARTIFRRLVNDGGTSADLRTVAQAFVDLQGDRIRADYDPEPVFNRSDAAQSVDRAAKAVALLRALPVDTRRWLVVQLITKPR